MATMIKATFQWGGTNQLLKVRNLEKGGKVQQAIDAAVIRHSIPYCPMATGTLMKSPNSVSTPGKVVYNTPYARYLYYGYVVTDEIGRTWVGKGEKKTVVTSKPINYSTDLNALAGAFWFERMKADHKDDILKEAKSVAGIK